MTEDNFKSCRMISGKPRWVIVNRYGEITNRSPSKEELKSVQEEIFLINKVNYNRTNTCDICGYNLELGPGHPHRERYIEGNWSGKWLCQKCFQSFDPNSSNNMFKVITNCRTGNVSLQSTRGKGDLFEELTSRWRGIKMLSRELDNYNLPHDHSRDPELGIIETKGRLYISNGRVWVVGIQDRELDKGYDNLIAYCASSDGKYIERIYIFPVEEIINRQSISIYKNPDPSKGSWVEKYRIKDEDVIRNVNKIWQEIFEENMILCQLKMKI